MESQIDYAVKGIRTILENNLKALDVKPRRTIRIGLWTGEEEGIFGSKGYCTNHFGTAKVSTAPDQMQLPEFMRKVAGPLEVKPEQKLVSA